MPPRQDANDAERQPLLQSQDDRSRNEEDNSESTQTQSIDFSPDDPENPKAWSERQKLTNVGIIALMAILSPLASSMFTPGIQQIADDLNADVQQVIATTTGFVIMLGIGPLVLAPFSETFGRRTVYIWCFSVFTLLQIPTAMSPNIETLIAMRTIAGMFGSKCCSLLNG